jgi:hypothetical protein
MILQSCRVVSTENLGDLAEHRDLEKRKDGLLSVQEHCRYPI